MNINKSIALVALCLFCLWGCTGKQVLLDRAIVRNNTKAIISKVRIHHEPTKNVGEVNSILPQSSFEVGFSESPMRAEKAIITWLSHNQTNEAEVLLPKRPPGTSGKTLVLVYSIFPNGTVTVELEK